MTYFGMPFGMWALFAGSFQKQLTAVLGYDADAAQAITKKAKSKYKAIIADLPEFESPCSGSAAKAEKASSPQRILPL